MTRLLIRLYAVALRAYPPGLRREYAGEMLQCARAAAAGRGLKTMPRLFADLAVSVPSEWLLLLKGLPMNGLSRDVFYAFRTLRRSPGFTLAAVSTLALGIGANTAIFTLADATVLRPLRVADPQRLVAFTWSASLPDYREWTTRTDVFTGIAAAANVRVAVAIDGVAEPIDSALVSPNYFTVLGVGASAGRLLGPGDATSGDLAVVIDRDWWQTRLNADTAAVGSTIHVSGAPATIVGIVEDGFRGTSLARPPKIYLPVSSAARLLASPFSAPRALENRGFVWLTTIGRLRPGVSAAAAAAAMDAMYAHQHPDDKSAEPRVELMPLGARALGDANGVSTFVGLLAAVVALTLLIGCANVANLQLARAAARRHEIGVRLAIGAGRARIFRQLLAESLVLAGFGGAIGLEVASLCLRLISRFQLPGGLDIGVLPLGVNRTALTFAVLVSGTTVVLSGLLPAWQAARDTAPVPLRIYGRVTTRSRLRSGLVAAQLALSLVLLAGTALFIQSLTAAVQVPLGFVPAGAATTTLTPSVSGFDRARAARFFDETLVRVHRLPGVTAVAWTNVLPVNGSMSMSATIAGYQKRPGDDTHVYVANVGPEYFAAAGTRLLRGRAFGPADTAGAPLVGIVNETAVKQFWRDRDPLMGRIMVDDTHFIQIVGVVEDTKIRSLDERPSPYLYAPFAQPSGPFAMDRGTLIVRTSGDVRALVPALGDELRAVDPRAPLTPVRPFEWQVRQLVMPQRMGAAFFSAFALLALTLASIGIYGVASYVTALRTREIGIRIALGADRNRIRALVLREGAIPIAAGLAAGLAIALPASRFAAAFLRGVAPHDPATYAAVTCLLACVALGATWLPARRAADTDPVTALRGN
ncbi:MAG TPA: ABC transporter permease [Vicinamibacterales bacterium]